MCAHCANRSERDYGQNRLTVSQANNVVFKKETTMVRQDYEQQVCGCCLRLLLSACQPSQAPAVVQAHRSWRLLLRRPLPSQRQPQRRPHHPGSGRSADRTAGCALMHRPMPCMARLPLATNHWSSVQEPNTRWKGASGIRRSILRAARKKSPMPSSMKDTTWSTDLPKVIEDAERPTTPSVGPRSANGGEAISYVLCCIRNFGSRIITQTAERNRP